MTFKIKADRGTQRVIVSIRNLPATNKRGIRQGMYFVGRDVRNTARQLILDRSTKTGRIYIVRKGSRRFKHQSSAPGQAPANLTGNLRRGIGFNVVGALRMEFGARAEYAPFLELGTTRMKRRPYLIAAINKNIGTAQVHFSREIERAIKNEIT